MASIDNPRDFLILTNNPLAAFCLEGRGPYTIRLEPDRRDRKSVV